jgi:hypothetical protein
LIILSIKSYFVFRIDLKTGAIFLIAYVQEGTYSMEIWVNDTVRGAKVVSTVNVNSFTITKEPVFGAASFRVKGMLRNFKF